MIEINLIPGSGKKSRKGGGGGGGSKLNVGASLGNLKAKVRDPYMLGAIGSAIVAILVTGGLYTMQESRTARLEDELQKAVQDSTRYASVLREREKAEAKRDTVLRSLNMIRAIDDGPDRRVVAAVVASRRPRRSCVTPCASASSATPSTSRRSPAS